MATMTLGDARNAALAEAMRVDERVIVMGGIAGRPGMAINVPAEFASRTIDIPISELGAVGAAIGAAVVGMRPVVTVHIGSFLYQAWPQIVQEAANLHFQSGGRVSVPLVVHMESGITGDAESRAAAQRPETTQSIFDRPWGSQGAQHSQFPEALLCSVPGIEVVCPSTAADVGGLLLGSIASPNPTVFIEHRDLLFTTAEVPDEVAAIPLGKAAIRRRGADIVLIAYSVMAPRAERAAAVLAAEHGVDATVLDLRSLAPLDTATILEEVSAVGRVVLIEQGHRGFGVGAGIASILAEHAFGALRAPIGFVATPDVPVPFSISMLDAIAPTTNTIVETALRTVRA